ncbi:MAG TPA: TetR/AcrR family transcriptional regulator [Propionibacteriaceae bacterium]
MPKLVDHTLKKREIIEATWRVVAARGFEAATMREIAAAAGHANGALSYYFANKEELLQATYMFVWEETNRRIAARLDGAVGVDAIRIYWEEISPSTELAALEAKIVLPFFARAATDSTLGRITARTLNQWRQELTVHVEQARAARQIVVAVSTPLIVEQLLTMLMGLQIVATDAPVPNDREHQRAILAAYLGLLGVAPEAC